MYPPIKAPPIAAAAIPIGPATTAAAARPAAPTVAAPMPVATGWAPASPVSGSAFDFSDDDSDVVFISPVSQLHTGVGVVFRAKAPRPRSAGIRFISV